MTEDEFIKLIGNKIKNKREELGLRQIDFAHLIGIEDSSLRRIESGRTNPTVKTLFRIAKALKIELSELM